MSKIRRASVTTPTPKAFVKASLSHIGLPCGSNGKPYTSTPYWAHSIADYVIAVLNMPSMVISYSHRMFLLFCLITSTLLNLLGPSGMHMDIRKRALKKKEREAKKQ